MLVPIIFSVAMSGEARRVSVSTRWDTSLTIPTISFCRGVSAVPFTGVRMRITQTPTSRRARSQEISYHKGIEDKV